MGGQTSERLGVRGWIWANHPHFAYVPVVLAECLSWSGVLLGNARFFCCEYLVWCIIAAMWVWDGAELLHKSKRWGDQGVHAILLLAGLGLFLFNVCLEIPH